MTDAPKKVTQQVQAIPEYAHVVLVPVANPSTAADLLHVAVALASPDDGRVIALTVSTGNMETEAEAMEALEGIVEEIRTEGHKIEMESITASSIARGILDAAREFGADLTILGLEQPQHGEVILGKVVETVMETATCDVLVYRRPQHDDGFKRVVVPIDNSFQSQVSARLGLLLAHYQQATVEAMHVQGSHQSQYEGLAQIESALAQIPGHRQFKRTVVNAQDTAGGILSRTQADDLIIMGFSQRSEFERLTFGNIANRILNRATGPVIMVSRARARTSTTGRLARRFASWLRPTLTRVEQDDIIRQAQLNASITIDYTVLIIVSAMIATLGLLLNSPAVIIGAMLVAPLMSPLISLASGLAVGRVLMARRAAITVVFGVFAALLVAYGIGSILPRTLPTAEMLSRGRPTLVDAGVALASGIIGAYATARKDIPAALAGVAIAAALVPPLCTVGLGLAFNNYDLAFGSAILFLTNIFCIIAAGMVVFLYLGLSLRRYDDVSGWQQIAALMLFFLAGLPVAYEVTLLTREVGQEAQIRENIEQGLSSSELVDLEIRQGSPTRIIATVRSTRQITLENVLELESTIADSFGRTIQLDLVVLPVVSFEVDPDVNPEDIEMRQSPLIEGVLGTEEATPEPEATPETTPEVTPIP